MWSNAIKIREIKDLIGVNRKNRLINPKIVVKGGVKCT